MKILKQEEKIIVKSEVADVENEGLVSLLGKDVTLFCANYIYTGQLIGVNVTCVKLANPRIVYETGSFADKTFKDAQSLGVESFYVQTSFIESFGVLAKK